MDDLSDEIPELEDCSHLINRTMPGDRDSEIKIETVSTKTVDADHTNNTVGAAKPSLVTNNETVNSKAGFGGMKKGFLLGSSKKNVSNSNKSANDVPFIRSNKEQQNRSLIMTEVQEKLIKNKSDWLTDDLLKTVQDSDDISSLISNPEFAVVLGEFQKNPTAAMLKYKDNKKIMDFFLKFAHIMGDHFTKIGTKPV